MARRGDTRSPSPAGSSFSKRSRRDDDRYHRDHRTEGKSYRRRSRSRSPDVSGTNVQMNLRLDRIGVTDSSISQRYRARDSHHRRDRSLERRGDRLDDGAYHGSRRERSRDHRDARERSRDRARDRSRERDRRPRSRDREYRDRRGDSRDRVRKRRDGSTDSKRRTRRDDSRERASRQTLTINGHESPRPSTPGRPSNEEQKKVERLAKLEAWKQKQAAERERKEKEAANADPRTLLDEIDRKAAQSQAAQSQAAQSPAAQYQAAQSQAAQSQTTQPSAATSPKSPALASPTPYAGKFDPKAIAKKVAGNSTVTAALGEDISVPVNVKTPSALNPKSAGLQADSSKAGLSNGSSKNISAQPLKASGNVSGFGLGARAQGDTDKGANRRAIDLEDEQSTRKKLEKLPTPPPEGNEINGHTEPIDGADEGDDDVDMQDAGTEEETAAAARAAAEKREERIHNESIAHQAELDAQREESNGDLQMTEAAEVPTVGEEGQQEELDPLDAFMSDLSQSRPSKPTKSLRPVIGKSKQQEPEALFGDEDADLSTLHANPNDILAMASKARKKKEIPTVNHSNIEYEPFRKNFYSEPAELAEMTEDEVVALRFELDGIKVRGVDVPKPVQKWSQCGLGAQTLEVIQKLGFDKPTSIQAQAVPAIMSGRDVIGVAKTGSGKTVAFLLPMFRHIKDQRPLDPLDGPVGLIMTPTRELATQIHKECKPYLKALNLRAVCAYGGAPIKDQIADLKRGAEIVVCTPGRLIDLLTANQGRVTNLRRVTYVVLDEADRMFDMGFEPQVMKILANLQPQRQTVLFSATFPRNMEALARKTLTKPVEIVVGGRAVVAPEITQIVEVIEESEKFRRTLQLLGELLYQDDDARALIFVQRQESAESLLKAILDKGYACNSLHGGKDQFDRDSTIEDYKNGYFPVLIATSVAARGLDVKQLKLVINYDAPNHLEDYVHRAGRTGRAGNTGTAVTFVTPEQDRYAVDIVKALKQSGQPVPEALQKLADSFLEKVKAGKEKASGSGFGGKGLERLDLQRDAERTRERKTFKTGDEGDDEEKEEKKEEEVILVKAAGAPSTPAAPLPGVPKGIDLDGKVTVHKTEIAESSTSGNPLDRVNAVRANIHGRLSQAGHLRQGVPIDNKGPDAGAYHATLEINDFPQKARWAVTNRTNVAKILESTGTSITTKGSFYAAGKEPGPTDNPKLYILVEGDTENVVTDAMKELMRLLKEGTAAAVEGESRAPGGRYSVV